MQRDLPDTIRYPLAGLVAGVVTAIAGALFTLTGAPAFGAGNPAGNPAGDPAGSPGPVSVTFVQQGSPGTAGYGTVPACDR